MLMLEKAQLQKSKLDEKRKYIHAWRNVSSMIFDATVAMILICLHGGGNHDFASCCYHSLSWT